METKEADELLQGFAQRYNDKEKVEAAGVMAQILSNMSHELRTPLNSIIGFTELILYGMEGPLTKSQRESLTKVVKNGYQLLTIINDLLDISKIKSGNMHLELKVFDFRSMLAELIHKIQSDLDEKGLKFEFNYPNNLPLAYGDVGKVRQVLSNLLTNAVKFTKGGAVGIVCEDLPNGDFIQILVWDTGIGIPDGKKPSIFDAFWQIDGTMTREFGGMGLGLALSKYIVELHGGKIWVEDNPSGGSRFYFTIPKVQKGSKIRIRKTMSVEERPKKDRRSKKVNGKVSEGLNIKPCAVIKNDIHWCDESELK